MGNIDSLGNYSLTTAGKPGAPLGKYKVVVRPPEKDLMKMVKKGLSKESFFLKYSNVALTPLTVTVEASPKAGAYDLSLTRKQHVVGMALVNAVCYFSP
jgi:hypothetical protein